MPKVTDVAEETAAPYVESAAFVAVTLQVHADVAFSDPLVIEQPDAVPFATEYVTAPSPAPPDVSRVNDDPKTPVVLETVSAGVCGGSATHCAYKI